MRRIKNPWVGRDGYFCFGCCPHNEAGMKMDFYADGEEVVSRWAPEVRYQGWIDTLHGGIQAVLLDEICAWAVMYRMNTSGVTSRMETRYRKSISTNDAFVQLRARVTEVRRNLATVEATLCNSRGEVCTQAVCTYFTFSPEKAAEMGFMGCELGPETDSF